MEDGSRGCENIQGVPEFTPDRPEHPHLVHSFISCIERHHNKTNQGVCHCQGGYQVVCCWVEVSLLNRTANTETTFIWILWVPAFPLLLTWSNYFNTFHWKLWQCLKLVWNKGDWQRYVWYGHKDKKWVWSVELGKALSLITCGSLQLSQSLNF